jgi:hypothetical protein
MSMGELLAVMKDIREEIKQIHKELTWLREKVERSR